ncbi:MAG: NAD(P)H-hydrate dehydratase [Sphingobium sp.]|nr:NAD(P)H-hydrate dehydratase [Sphingobium sp.]
MKGAAIVTAAEMRTAEQALFASGIAEYDVMVRAGRAIASIIWRVGAQRDVLVLCGPGNNGGDGYVIARVLRDYGVPVRVAALALPVTPSAQQAFAEWGGPVEEFMAAFPATQIVDALFGTGLTRGLDAAVSGQLSALAQQASYVYAVDLPSGISTDDGAVLSPVPHYSLCLSVGAWKRAHMLRPAISHWDDALCLDIGVDGQAAKLRHLERPVLSAPADDAHKYRRGLVAVVAGSMAGAAALAAQAAARGGAGYVRLLGAQAIVETPHAIVRASLRNEEKLSDDRISALLIGPGLGRSDMARERLRAGLATPYAKVLDADALWLLAEEERALPFATANILTPHEGEFARLFPDIDGPGGEMTVIDRALAASSRCGAVVVLKGPTTVIAAPDGRARVAERASSWLSTAGTGDVLAGLCAARLAVTHDPFTTACEAVWLHADAARRAGPAFIADDLLCTIAPSIESCL